MYMLKLLRLLSLKYTSCYEVLLLSSKFILKYQCISIIHYFHFHADFTATGATFGWSGGPCGGPYGGACAGACVDTFAGAATAGGGPYYGNAGAGAAGFGFSSFGGSF